MIGVSMAESGITKVVQIPLDEDMINGRAKFDEADNFVEEDVEPEQGIVIPPRPPRREHNPDGTLKIKKEEKEPEHSDCSTDTEEESSVSEKENDKS
jgi:chromosome segregation protein